MLRSDEVTAPETVTCPAQQRRKRRIEGLDLRLKQAREPSLHLARDLLHGQVARLVPGHEAADADPRQRHHLNVAGPRPHPVRLQRVAHGDVRHLKGREDLDRRGPVGHVGQVVVAHRDEHRDTCLGHASDTAGELTLVGLAGVAGLVGVAGEEDQVNAVVQRVLNGLVQRGQEVQQPGGGAKVLTAVYAGSEGGGQRVQVGLGGGPAVILDPYVDVGQVQDSHGGRVAGGFPSTLGGAGYFVTPLNRDSNGGMHATPASTPCHAAAR